MWKAAREMGFSDLMRKGNGSLVIETSSLLADEFVPAFTVRLCGFVCGIFEVVAEWCWVVSLVSW